MHGKGDCHDRTYRTAVAVLDDPAEQPAVAVDPRTGQVYRLIKQEVYDLVCGMIKPYNRGWDPDDDLIRKDV